MASTRFRMIGSVLFVVAFSALEAYQWGGGPEDKAKITACLGGSASFPWSIVTGSDRETILNIEWRFQAPDKEKTTIATYESKHFYTTDSVRFGFLANAGLSLRYARPQDSGNYSVQVEIQQANSSLASAQRTVTLSVTDLPPATQDGALYVTLSDAVRDDVTQNWTLQLHCGQIVDLGQPPVDVVWKTPSGEVKNSSYQDNGTFVLSVSSPVQGGNYSCQLSPSAPAVRCLTSTSPLNAAAQLYVDDKDVRLSFLEAHLREMEAENLNLTTQLSTLTNSMENVQRGSTLANCADWLKVDPRSAIRTVFLSGEPITVYCDQTTDNGGWIVFQRRQDASVDFNQNWMKYRNGLVTWRAASGLDKLHRLTTSQKYELRVDLHTWDGTKGKATYSGFYLEDVSLNFTLRYDKFTGGNAGDGLNYHRGNQFSTPDCDHTGGWQCAKYFKAAWWYKACYTSNLNGHYKNNGSAPNQNGLSWVTFRKETYSMKFTEMKIRPI